MLGVDAKGYSIWGASTYSSSFPPTFIAVSADDPIATVEKVERRVQRLRSVGVEVEYRRYENAGHGVGRRSG